MNVSLLSGPDAPYLGYIILAFYSRGVFIDSVICDSILTSEKDKIIAQERTAGRMPEIKPHEYEDLHIPFFFVKNHNSDTVLELIRKRDIDILVNAGTPRILKSAILRAPSVGIVNCHPGLLPTFRGCTCVEWAIYLDEQAGNTAHFMTEGIDEGPIILSEGLTFSKRDQYADIRIAVYRHNFDLMARAVKKVIEENITIVSLPPQSEGRYFSVIEPTKMRAVIDKLNRGEYAFQVTETR